MRGLTRCLNLIFGALFAHALVRADALETSHCRLARVPDLPSTRDRHTMLLAHFDGDSQSDADYARVHVDQSGYNVDAAVEGRFGRGVAVHGQSGFVLFPGLDNYQRLTGTAEFWVR